MLPSLAILAGPTIQGQKVIPRDLKKPKAIPLVNQKQLAEYLATNMERLKDRARPKVLLRKVIPVLPRENQGDPVMDM